MALNTEMKIQILAKENPRREGSAGHKNWKLYRNGMTVEKYLEAKGATRGHLAWDISHGAIKLVK